MFSYVNLGFRNTDMRLTVTLFQSASCAYRDIHALGY